MDLRWCFNSGKTWVRQLLMTDFGAAKLFSHKGVERERERESEREREREKRKREREEKERG